MRGHFQFRSALSFPSRARSIAAVFLVALLAGRATQAQQELSKPQPQPSTSSIHLEAASDHEVYLEGGENEIYIEARVHADPPPEQSAHAPVRNIAFVLDRSGSMAGEPIQALRQAVAATLDSLSENDIVSVVVFGSEVETLIDAQRCDHARDLFSRVGQIEPAGGAALYDALNQGAAQLRRYAGPSTINRLILVSDGRPTKGPREFEDFSKLADLFTHEGTTISTIGLGEDFDEDLLATLARIGNGRFRYADKPEKLADALEAEIASLQTIVARDVVLTVEFQKYCDDVKSHGTPSATIEGATGTLRLPFVFAGQNTGVLVSGKVDSFRSRIYLGDIVTARLRWNDAADGKPHELSKTFSFSLTTDTRVIHDMANAQVFRAAASATISEGMQKAIEQLDKGDFRRAVRELRHARDDVRDINYRLDDPAIAAQLRQLEAYITEVQARGMNQLDRKVLRSGLFNQFETPEADDAAKKN